MTLYEFNQLPLNERCEYVWSKGAPLAFRSTTGFTINLHSVHDFFCEIWYKAGTNSVDNIKCFNSKEAFEPYVDLIKINL
jgi:hypothetical protein